MIDFQRLKDIREDNDINQETMSQILGVPRSTYSMWELGISVIPLKPLCDFSDYFNITLDYALNKTSKNLIKGLDLQVLANNMKERINLFFYVGYLYSVLVYYKTYFVFFI